MEEITEQIGNVEDLPEWAQEAFNEGTLIKTCIARVEAAKKAMSTKSPLRKQCHEYILELGELGRQLADVVESQQILGQELFNMRAALEKIRWLLADKAERIPMTNFGREIDEIAEQALKGGGE